MSAADWLSSRMDVAEVAANVVGRLALPESAYCTGTVQWHLDAGGRQLHAHNVGSQEVTLAYAVAHPTTSDSALQPLPPHTSYNATVDLATFGRGRLTVAPVVPGPGADRLIATTIGSLGLGVAVRLVAGVDVTVLQDERTGLFKVRISASAAPVEARVQLTATGGSTVCASARFSGAPDEPVEREVELPPGVDLSPVVQALCIELLVPLSVYERATAERRGTVRNGLPDAAAPATAAS